MIRQRIADNRLATAAVCFLGYTAVMLVLERRMRGSGGPGIIPFELAGSASRAEDIMTRWGSDVSGPPGYRCGSTSATWRHTARSPRS